MKISCQTTYVIVRDRLRLNRYQSFLVLSNVAWFHKFLIDGLIHKFFRFIKILLYYDAIWVWEKLLTKTTFKFWLIYLGIY